MKPISLADVAARIGLAKFAGMFTGQRSSMAMGDSYGNRSKYEPHQGAQECARRIRQGKA